MDRSFFSKQRILLAVIALLGLLAGAYLFRDELFPNPGIYLQYIGAQDYPVAPVVITLRPLSAEKIKNEFNWELPTLVPQYAVSKADLAAMIKQTLSLLPAVDSAPGDAQFVITVATAGGTKKKETDGFKSRVVLNDLLQLSKPKYGRLSMELLNLEDYSLNDKRHPIVSPIPLPQKKKFSKNSKSVKTKKKIGP